MNKSNVLASFLSLSAILCHITNNQPLNLVIMAIQENNYGVFQFREEKTLKSWQKTTDIILLPKLSPPVRPVLTAYYVIRALTLFSKSLRTETSLFDYLCSSKGLDIYLSNAGQKLAHMGSVGWLLFICSTVTRFGSFSALSNGQRTHPSKNSLVMSSKCM